MSYQSKRKTHVMLSVTMYDEIIDEAKRQKRTRSWLAQKAWLLSRDLIRAMPSKGNYTPMKEESILLDCVAPATEIAAIAWLRVKQ